MGTKKPKSTGTGKGRPGPARASGGAAARRAQQRARAAAEALQERQAEQHLAAAYRVGVVEAGTTEAPDAAADAPGALVVIDRVGTGTLIPSSRLRSSSSAAALAAKAAKAHKKAAPPSEQERRQLERLLQVHSAAELEALAARGRELPRRRAPAAAPDHDLWDEVPEVTQAEPPVLPAMSGIKPARPLPDSSVSGAKRQRRIAEPQRMASASSPPPAVAVDAPRPGQSYRPEPAAHQGLLATAAALEVEREAMLKELRAPLARGMSAATRALLLPESEGESETEDDASADGRGNEDGTGADALAKRPVDKLTRAQRNRQKRLRQEKTQTELAKRQKLLERQVGELPRYRKELKQKQRDQKEAARRRADGSTRAPGKDLEVVAYKRDPARAPTLPVPLHAASSLRRLQPQGSLLQERLASWRDRQLLAQPQGPPAQKRRRPRRVKGGSSRDQAQNNNVVVLG